LIEWRSPDRTEELIVGFNHNVINLYFKTSVERQYFSAMKKHITWNSVQTWVT